MAFHHRDLDRRHEGLTAKQADDGMTAFIGDVDVGQVVETLGRALINQAQFRVVGGHNVAEWSEGLFGQRL
jgi:hypothetical protein